MVFLRKFSLYPFRQQLIAFHFKICYIYGGREQGNKGVGVYRRKFDAAPGGLAPTRKI